jgi:hypothetical protein
MDVIGIRCRGVRHPIFPQLDLAQFLQIFLYGVYVCKYYQSFSTRNDASSTAKYRIINGVLT